MFWNIHMNINRSRFDVIKVPAGILAMGSTQEEVEYCVTEWSHRLIDPTWSSVFRDWISKEIPQHFVSVGALEVMRFPVRNSEYCEFLSVCKDSPMPESLAIGLPVDHPVWGVGLEQAQTFAVWRSERDGCEWRLPTEAEWEWIAAGPDNRHYPYGNDFDLNRANTTESGLKCTTPVDAYPQGASWCGVMDLAGNVEEWTSSRYAPYLGGVPIDDDLTRLVGPSYPILRGGSFELGGDLSRCKRRHGPHPGYRFRVTGFRLVRVWSSI
jgi:toxoflavin biosynthesis protein ToxD